MPKTLSAADSDRLDEVFMLAYIVQTSICRLKQVVLSSIKKAETAKQMPKLAGEWYTPEAQETLNRLFPAKHNVEMGNF